MGFFKDFKRDFAQAVNELMPDKDELANEYDDEDMVNTFDEEDNMEVAPEDLFEDLDDFTIGKENIPPQVEEKAELETFDDEPEEEEESLNQIPNAEILSEPSEVSIDDFGDESMEDSVVIDLSAEEEETEDELQALEELDEENMQENLDDAFLTENEDEDTDNHLDELKDVDLNKAVEDAIMKHDEDMTDMDYSKEDSMADLISTKDSMEQDIREKEQDAANILSDDTTYITKGTTIKGDIETDGGVDIIGAVEGNVTCAGKLIVGGSVKGNVDAGEVYANAAKIEGEILAEGSVKVGVGSVVVGNIKATSAVIAGAVNGDIDVQGPVIVDSTAVIMGNIKSRSVQINNGAVIEGFCSQCYSEIDVKSFFE